MFLKIIKNKYLLNRRIWAPKIKKNEFISLYPKITMHKINKKGNNDV